MIKYIDLMDVCSVSRIGMISNVSVNLQTSYLSKGLQYWNGYINYDRKKISDDVFYLIL